MASGGAAGFHGRVSSPSLIAFSDDEEGGGAAFSPGGETEEQPWSPGPRDELGGEQPPRPLPRCTLQTTPPKVNSVRVPFDPDDQSDDEVIITSVFKKQTAPPTSSAKSDSSHDDHSSTKHKTGDGTSSNKANAKGHRAASSARKGRQGSHKKAAPPESAKGTMGGSSSNRGTPNATSHTATPPEQPLVPLSAITGARSQPLPNLVSGSVYPGKNVKFCPWFKVVNYHTQYVGKANGARVAPYFELSELLKCQDWDLCYLWHPAKDKQKTSLLFVPTEQVTVFLERINKTLAIHLTIPAGEPGDGFRAVFGSQKTPVPRFLGHARDPAALDALLKSVPPRHPDDAIMTPQAEAFYLKKIKGLFGRLSKAEQKKMKTDKAKKKRVTEHKRWGRQAKRIQRYLGLRKSTAVDESGSPRPPISLDLTKPAPFESEGDVLFVAMDIESYEHHHSTLTEIGFAVLDTRDVVGVPPGPNGGDWHKLIQARHIRIRENAHMVNRHFLQGCENNFNFGTSEFVRLRDILPLVTAMLQPKDADHGPRKVILVGHDIRSDIKMVKNVGFHVKDGMFLEVVDTQDLHQHYRSSTQNAGLRAVLYDLDIKHMFLHNAGNDAVYTMQALITLAIDGRKSSLHKQKARLDSNYKPDPAAVEQGWDTGGELSDGGLPDEDTPFVESEGAAAKSAASPRAPSRHGTPRVTTTPPALQASKPVDPWPALAQTTAPAAVATWPPPVTDQDDLIDL